MNTISKFNFFILISIFLFSGIGSTQEQKEKKPDYVDEIVVLGELVSDTATVKLITAKQIKKSNAKNVAEVLERVSGTYVRVGGKGEAYIRVRGFTQSGVSVLIDGVAVSSPYSGQLDLSTLPVANIQRIEVVKGASSVMYGSNSMGGVINIITRRGNGINSTSFNGEYGTGNSQKLGLSTSGSAGVFTYLLSGSYLNQDYYPLSSSYQDQKNQSGFERENSDRQSYNGSVNLAALISDQQRISINFRHIDQNRGLPHHESDKKAKFWRFTDWQQGVFDLVYDYTTLVSSLKAKVFYEYLNDTLDSYDDSTYTTQAGKYGYTDFMESRALGGDIMYKYNLSENILLKSALRFRQDNTDRRDDSEIEWTSYQVNILGIPVEMEWKLAKKVHITAGLSLDMMNFESLENQEKKSSLSFNPQAAFLYNLNSDLDFKLSLSGKSRFPTMRELFSSSSGNPDLFPMSAFIIDAGFKYRVSPDLLVSVVGFYNDITNLINRKSKNDLYDNIDSALFTGLELGVKWQASSWMDFTCDYTYLSAEDRSNDSVQYIEHRPPHKLDSSVFVKLPAGFSLITNISYVSSQKYWDGDDAADLDPFTILDLVLRYKLNQKIEFFLNAKNLFDVDYSESYGYPREGRIITAGFNLEL